jgi:hypothetical protein
MVTNLLTSLAYEPIKDITFSAGCKLVTSLSAFMNYCSVSEFGMSGVLRGKNA